MKFLIAISSCERFENNGWNGALRNTWLKDSPVDYKFFHGRGAAEKDDVVVLNAGDHYEALTEKTCEKFRWAIEHGYDYVFHCYHDTYAVIERLLSSGFENYDFFGDYLYREDYIFLQSGQGYFISKKAMELVVEELPIKPTKHGAQYLTTSEEDVWVGLIVADHLDILKREHNPNMPCMLRPDDKGPLKGNNVISVHLSTIAPIGYTGQYEGYRESEWKYRPEYMHKMHREWEESCG